MEARGEIPPLENFPAGRHFWASHGRSHKASPRPPPKGSTCIAFAGFSLCRNTGAFFCAPAFQMAPIDLGPRKPLRVDALTKLTWIKN